MGNRSREQTATIIQYRLKKIGIKMNIRVLEWSTFINEFIDKRRFETVILGWSIGIDPDQYDIWHSSKIREKEFNFVSYSNPEVDELLEKGRRTFDIEKGKRHITGYRRYLPKKRRISFYTFPTQHPLYIQDSGT